MQRPVACADGDTVFDVLDAAGDIVGGVLQREHPHERAAFLDVGIDVMEIGMSMEILRMENLKVVKCILWIMLRRFL